MSVAGKKAAFILTLLVALTTLAVGSASAQVGPGNPSGGSSLRQTTEEGTGSFTRVGFLSRSLSVSTGWQSWLWSYAVSRSLIQIAPRPSDGRSFLAVTRRPFAWR